MNYIAFSIYSTSRLPYDVFLGTGVCLVQNGTRPGPDSRRCQAARVQKLPKFIENKSENPVDDILGGLTFSPNNMLLLGRVLLSPEHIRGPAAEWYYGRLSRVHLHTWINLILSSDCISAEDTAMSVCVFETRYAQMEEWLGGQSAVVNV